MTSRMLDEAREAPEEQHLRLSLLRRLVTKPRWLIGTGLALLGWVAQVGALLLIPLTLLVIPLGLLLLPLPLLSLLLRLGLLVRPIRGVIRPRAAHHRATDA